MLFSDVTFSTEGIVIVTALVTALAGTVGVLFRMIVSGYEAQLKSMTSDRDSWREMSGEAVGHLESLRERTDGKLKPLAPIVPEHSSPVTAKQQQAADIGTMRARLVAVTLAMGLPARVAGK